MKDVFLTEEELAPQNAKNKSLRNKIFGALAILLTVTILAVFVDGWMWAFTGRSLFLFDTSAEGSYGGDLYWKGNHYVPVEGFVYAEAKAAAQTKDGLTVSVVKGDRDRNYVIVRSLLDQCYLVRDDYEPPTEGEITSVAINHRMIEQSKLTGKNDDLYDAVADILASAKEDLTLELSESEYRNLTSRSLHVGYEDCPVAAIYCGSFVKIDGVLYLSTNYSSDDGTVSVSLYAIPKKYVSIIERFF